MARLPLFVVTGFLGSGKTTLVQRYLGSPDGAGTGVVVNEFGEAGLDHTLVVHAAEHVELVGNGCMCCARRADIGRALYDLVRMTREGGRRVFSRAIVETSGLADPAPIIATLERDPWLKHHIRLAGVITVVDAVAGLANLATKTEARRQVAIADRVVITKTDLRAAQDPQRIAEAAMAIAPDSAIHDSQDPDFSLAQLFDEREAVAPIGRRGRVVSEPAEAVSHDAAIGSFTLALPERVDWPAFTLWLSALLHAHGDRILRVKGLVRSSSSEAPLVIHGVQHTMHPPVHLTGEDDGRPSFLVFITRELELGPIAASLKRVLALAERGSPSLADGARADRPARSPSVPRAAAIA